MKIVVLPNEVLENVFIFLDHSNHVFCNIFLFEFKKNVLILIWKFFIAIKEEFWDDSYRNKRRI